MLEIQKLIDLKVAAIRQKLASAAKQGKMGMKIRYRGRMDVIPLGVVILQR